MAEQRLRSIALLNIESKTTKKIDYDNVVEIFKTLIHSLRDNAGQLDKNLPVYLQH
jgi:hypothetical protein